MVAALLGVAVLLPGAAPVDARNRNRKGCKRKAIKICTGFVCGQRKNNCGKSFNCQCRAGTICLPNGACGLPCATGCPSTSGLPCACTTTGESICLLRDLSCEALPTRCVSTSDCPDQAACGETLCGPAGATERRCVPLCRG